MIEDKELRDLFKIESAEHISRLEDGFLRLEKEPENHALLEDVFREAHSLKGAARMLGLADIQDVAHSMEDIIGAAAKGRASLTSEAIDSLYKKLDAINRLVNEAISNAEFGVRSAELKKEKEEEKSEDGEVQIPHSEFKIETVRVDTKRLDELMTQSGELSVTKGRIAQRLAETEEIIELLEKLKMNVERDMRHAKYDMRNISQELTSKIQNLRSKIGEDSARLEFIADELEDGI